MNKDSIFEIQIQMLKVELDKAHQKIAHLEQELIDLETEYEDKLFELQCDIARLYD